MKPWLHRRRFRRWLTAASHVPYGAWPEAWKQHYRANRHLIDGPGH